MAYHSETDAPSLIEAHTPSVVATLNIDALYLTVYGGIMNNRSADTRRITVTAGLLLCLNVSTHTRNLQNLNRVVARYQRLRGLTLIRSTKRRVLTCSSTFVSNLYPRKCCMFHLLIFS